MRIAHIAYSVPNRELAADFFCENFGYRIKDPKSKGTFLVLDPPEKAARGTKNHRSIRQFVGPFLPEGDNIDDEMFSEFHMPPEILISESFSGSGHIGIHHVAYEVDNIKEAGAKFRDLGLVEGGCPECRGMSCFTIKNSRDFLGLSIEVFSRNLEWEP